MIRSPTIHATGKQRLASGGLSSKVVAASMPVAIEGDRLDGVFVVDEGVLITRICKCGSVKHVLLNEPRRFESVQRIDFSDASGPKYVFAETDGSLIQVSPEFAIPQTDEIGRYSMDLHGCVQLHRKPLRHVAGNQLRRELSIIWNSVGCRTLPKPKRRPLQHHMDRMRAA